MKQYGKGSKPRPFTDMKSYLDNWDSVFGKRKFNGAGLIVKTKKKKTTKNKKELCPHCATVNLKRIDTWTVKCSKCGFER